MTLCTQSVTGTVYWLSVFKCLFNILAFKWNKNIKPGSKIIFLQSCSSNKKMGISVFILQTSTSPRIFLNTIPKKNMYMCTHACTLKYFAGSKIHTEHSCWAKGYFSIGYFSYRQRIDNLLLLFHVMSVLCHIIETICFYV